eukprot:COSAG04_NODE_630_length_11765_cov_6.900394_2_plen_157_part_00
MIFPFEVPIDDGDSRLTDKIIAEEGGALLAAMVRSYGHGILAADDQPFAKWKIPYFQTQRAMADPVFAFLNLSEDESDVYAKFSLGEVTTQRQLYCAVKQWMKNFDESQVKLEKVLDEVNKNLSDPGYVFEAANTSGNNWWCVRAPHLLFPNVASM